MRPGPRRHRRRDRALRGAHARDLPAALPAGHPHRQDRHRDRRADQVRLQQLPGREDLLHQRDRRAGREAWAPTSSTWPRPWAWTSASAPSSCTPGWASAAAACPRTPTPSSTSPRRPARDMSHRARGHRRERRACPARALAKAEAPGGEPGGQDRGPAGPGLQAQHRRHPLGRQPGAGQAAAGSAAHRARPRPGGHGQLQALPSRPGLLRLALRGLRGRRPVHPGHRVEPVPAARFRLAGRDHGRKCFPGLPERV